MRRIIYIATFNLFFHFYAQPLFVFIVIIIFIISTSLILSLLQLLLSLVVNSSSNSTNRVISFLLSLLVIALLKYQYHLLYQPLCWAFYMFPFVLDQYTPPRFFLRDHNGNKVSKLFLCYPCHCTLPQLLQFSIFMNLYFVYVRNIRFICDGEIYLLTYIFTRLFVMVAHLAEWWNSNQETWNPAKMAYSSISRRSLKTKLCQWCVRMHKKSCAGINGANTVLEI